MEMDARIAVYTLVGKKTFAVSELCLGSFCARSRDPYELRIVSDGTLDAGELGRLQRLPHAVLCEMPRFAPDFAERYPHLAELRNVNPLFRKVVDIPLLSGGRFAYLDSDIFFFRPFRGLFSRDDRWPTLAEDVAVSPGIRDLCRWGRRVLGIANTGVMQGPVLNFDDCECLVRGFADSKPNVREQNLYAMLWGIGSVRLIRRRSVFVAPRYWTLVRCCEHLRGCESAAAFHLTGNRKQWVHEVCARLAQETNVVEIAAEVTTGKPAIAAIMGKVARRVLRLA